MKVTCGFVLIWTYYVYSTVLLLQDRTFFKHVSEIYFQLSKSENVFYSNPEKATILYPCPASEYYYLHDGMFLYNSNLTNSYYFSTFLGLSCDEISGCLYHYSALRNSLFVFTHLVFDLLWLLIGCAIAYYSYVFYYYRAGFCMRCHSFGRNFSVIYNETTESIELND